MLPACLMAERPSSSFFDEQIITQSREKFSSIFPRKIKPLHNQVQACSLIRVWKYRQSFFVIFINYQKSFWIWKIYFSNFQIKMISNYFFNNWYSMVICHVCSGFIFKCIPYYSEVKEEIRIGHRCQKIPQCVPYITWFLMRTLGKSIWQSQFVPWMRTDTDL